MRILQVMEATLGGTRRYLEDIANACTRPGNTNAIAYSLVRADAGFRVLLERLKSRDWELFEIPMVRAVTPSDASSTQALRAVYRKFSPDLVHAHSSKAGALARLAAFGLSERPAIAYTPNSIATDLSPAYALAERALSPLLDTFIAVGESERAQLARLRLLPVERIPIVVPTIDANVFAPRDRTQARAELRYGDGPLVIAVGRLAEQKDPLGFVRFVSALRALVPEVRAVWVGDGDLRPRFVEAIAAANLSDVVTITGWMNDVRPYFAACNAFVSVAAYESFGYVTAEAFAAGRPVIASAITGTVDIVKTDTERQLFAAGDFGRAAELAREILLDPDLAAALAARGRASVMDRFSPEETQRQLDLAYDLTLATRHRRDRSVALA